MLRSYGGVRLVIVGMGGRCVLFEVSEKFECGRHVRRVSLAAVEVLLE